MAIRGGWERVTHHEHTDSHHESALPAYLLHLIMRPSFIYEGLSAEDLT